MKSVVVSQQYMPGKEDSVKLGNSAIQSRKRKSNTHSRVKSDEDIMGDEEDPQSKSGEHDMSATQLQGSTVFLNGPDKSDSMTPAPSATPDTAFPSIKQDKGEFVTDRVDSLMVKAKSTNVKKEPAMEASP